jgi:hypothetical protein
VSDLPDVLEVGQFARIRISTVDATGVSAVDPAAIALVVTQPDGTDVNKTLADFTNVTRGTNDYYFPITQAGFHRFHAVTTNPDDDIDGGFEAVASPGPLTDLVTPTHYQRITGDTTSSWAAVVVALREALAFVEEQTRRSFGYGTRTETLDLWRNGTVYPKATPVASVADPSTATARDGGIYIGGLGPANFFSSLPAQTTVTYTGGYKPFGSGQAPELPVKLARVLCRIAFLALHPSSIVGDGVPVGAKSASVGDVSVTGDLSGQVLTDASITRDLRRFTRKPSAQLAGSSWPR